MTISKPGIDFTQSPGSGGAGTFAPPGPPAPVEVLWDPLKDATLFTFDPTFKIATHNGPLYNNSRVYADLAKDSGKRYFEIQINESYAGTIAATLLGVAGGTGVETTYFGNISDEWSFDNRYQTGKHNNINATVRNGLDLRNDTHVFGMAIDFTTGNGWYHADGVWIVGVKYAAIDVPDPATGAFPMFENAIDGNGISGLVYPCVQASFTTVNATLLFDADEFVYTIPAGYTPWGSP